MFHVHQLSGGKQANPWREGRLVERNKADVEIDIRRAAQYGDRVSSQRTGPEDAKQATPQTATFIPWEPTPGHLWAKPHLDLGIAR